MGKGKEIFTIILSLIFLGSLFCGSFSWAQDTRWDSGQIEAEYFKAMASVDDETFQRKFEYPFLALLNDAQRAYYENLSNRIEKERFIQLYWKKNNPNPLLPENERLNLFLGRCTHVQIHFPSSQPPYYDDRGKYFLKYGKPQQRFEQEAGSKHVQFFANREVYDYVCNIS